MIAPGTAKKFITTNGRATKEEMQDAIQAILGDCPDDHNLSDAIAMALTVRWLWLTKNVGR